MKLAYLTARVGLIISPHQPFQEPVLAPYKTEMSRMERWGLLSSVQASTLNYSNSSALDQLLTSLGFNFFLQTISFSYIIHLI